MIFSIGEGTLLCVRGVGVPGPNQSAPPRLLYSLPTSGVTSQAGGARNRKSTAKGFGGSQKPWCSVC